MEEEDELLCEKLLRSGEFEVELFLENSDLVLEELLEAADSFFAIFHFSSIKNRGASEGRQRG